MKRILALLLSIVMAVSSLPLPALAAEVLPTEAPVAEEAGPQETTAPPIGATEAPMAGKEETSEPQETTDAPVDATETAPAESEVTEAPSAEEAEIRETQAEAESPNHADEASLVTEPQETVAQVSDKDPVHTVADKIRGMGDTIWYESEENDHAGIADLIKDGVTMCGSIGSWDTDYFEFDLSYESVVSITAQADSNTFYATLAKVGSYGYNESSYLIDGSLRMTLEAGEYRIIAQCRAGKTADYQLYLKIESQEIPCYHYLTRENVIAPTCTEKGYTVITCQNCGYNLGKFYYTDPDKDNHVHVTDKVTKATCVQQGYTTHTCEDCGKSWEDTYTSINVNNHTFAASEVVAPTCGVGGYTVYTCQGCGTTRKDDYTPATEMHSNIAGETVAPTCGAEGYTVYTCEVCGTVTKGDLVSATGEHSYTAGEVVAPTCIAQGYTVYTCEVCGDSMQSDFVSDPDSHSFTLSKVIAPTCGSDGYTSYVCVLCGQTKNEDMVPATGNHVYDDEADEVCNVCGGQRENLDSGSCGENLTWKLSDSGALIISGTGAMEDYGKGGPWSGHSSEITSLVLNPGITHIGSFAFRELNKVAQVTIPSGVKSIGRGAFKGCSRLTQVTIPESATIINREAFEGCTGLTEVTLPERLGTISRSVFSGCTALKKVTIPEGVTIIDSNAFNGCYALQSIYFLGNAPSIVETFAFPSGNLYAYYDQHNSTWTEDVRYSIGKGRFYWKPYFIAEGTCGKFMTWLLGADGTMTLRGGGEMDNFASVDQQPWYEYRTEIKALDMEYNTRHIGDYAFYGCENLASVYTPSTLKSIGKQAFGNCSSLKSHTFRGEAPSISPEAFYNTEMDAYYPVYLESWTAVVGKHYGGRLTWYPHVIGCTHSKQTVTEAKDPTCTEDGNTEGSSCSFCEKVLVAPEILPALGHQEVVDPGVAATCLESGLSEGKHCAVCQEVLVARQVLPALGHKEVADPAVDPGCTEPGYTEGSHCANCGQIFTPRETIPPLGHTEVTDPGREPNCTEAGLTEGKHCSVCQEILTAQEEIPALGHAYDKDDVILEPSCTEEGRYAALCRRCGENVEEAIPALGHDEVVDPAKEPTCLETGLTEGKHCSVCQEVFAAQEEIPALGHEETVLEAVEPDCIKTGLTEGKGCSRCGETLIPQEVIPALGHDMEGDSCNRCGLKGLVERGSCGETAEYELYENGTLLILGTGKIEKTDPQTGALFLEGNRHLVQRLEIQEGITAIGWETFRDMGSLRSMILPASLELIGNRAFSGTNLGAVRIPATVKTVEDNAFERIMFLERIQIESSETQLGDRVFYACGSLKEAILPEGLTEIPYDTFSECKQLVMVNIPSTVTKIGDWAFQNCALEEVILPEGLTVIKSRAFMNNKNLKKVTLPEALTELGEYAFFGCDKLKTVTFLGSAVEAIQSLPERGGILRYPGNDPSWTEAALARIGSGWTWQDMSKEAVAEGSCGGNAHWQLTADGTLTVTGSGTVENGFGDIREQVRRVVIGQGITEIAGYAFSGMPMAVLSAADSVKILGDYAFSDCNNLVTAALPGAEVLGQGAFYSCDKLTEVTLGTHLRGIPWDSFSECLSLGSITLPGGLEEIGGYAFHNCPLKEIVIPSSVQIIGGDAFSGTALKKITFRGEAPEIGDNAFLDVTAQVRCKNTWTEENKQSYGGQLTWMAADYVEISGEGEVLGGKTVKLKASIVSEDYQNSKILWSLTEGADALVKLKVSGSTATVTALDVTEVQTVTVIASAGENVSPCEYTLTLVPQPKEVQLVSPGEDSIPLIFEAGGEFQLELAARLLPEGAKSSLTWTSSNTKVVRVDETGMLYFTGKAGTAVITVKTENGVKTTASFKVVETVSEVAIVGDPWISLQGGESVTLKLLDLRTGRAVNSKNIRWSIRVDKGDPTAYATINASGKLTAKKLPYQAFFCVDAQVLTEGLVTAQATWDVTTYPAAIGLVIWEDADMATGQTRYFNLQNRTEMRLDASLLPEGVMEQEIQWTVSDKKEKYASYRVEDNGRSLVITDPTGELGTVTFTAKSTQGSKKSATVKVQFGVFAEEVEVLTNEMFLHSGDSLTLNAQTKPEKVTKGGITWSLADPGDKAYVTLSGNKLKAKTVYAEHIVTLVAASKDGRASTTYDISIVPEDPYLLTLREEISGKNVTNDTVYVDLNREDRQVVLRAEIASGEVEVTPQWSYKDSGTASFREDDGKLEITMLKAGTVKVTVKDGKQSATVTVKAANLAQSVEITTKNGKNLTEEGQIQVASGKTVDLKAILEGASGGKVSWSIVEGSQYAKLSSSGKLTAGKNITSTREVLVRAKALDGSDAEGEIRVYIKPLATGIHIYTLEGDMNRRSISAYSSGWKNTRSNTDNTWDMNENSGFKMYADVYPYNQYSDYDAAIQDVTWKSSNAKVASIDAQGQVTFHKPGTVTLTATAADGSGQKVSCKLTLIKRVTELQLEDAQVVGGKTLKLKPTVLPGDTTTKKFYWEIIDGDTAFAKIDPKGKLTTKKVTAPKTVTVRVWADDFTGVYADCVVTIYPKSQ